MVTDIFIYSKSTKELLLDLIACVNDVVFDETKAIFGEPKRICGTQTEIKLTMDPTSPLKGAVLLNYERLELDDFFFAIPVNFRLGAVDVLSKELISAQLLERFKIRIEPEDFEYTTIEYGESSPSKIAITANPNSLVWIGEFIAWVLPQNYLGDLFGEFNLDYNTKTIKTNAYVYSVEQNFPTMEQTLIDFLPLGKEIFTLDLDTQVLLTYLQEATSEPWVIDLDYSPYNLMNAKVIYTGLVAVDSPNYTVVLQVSTKCTQLTGNLVIEFPVPVIEPTVP